MWVFAFLKAWHFVCYSTYICCLRFILDQKSLFVLPPPTQSMLGHITSISHKNNLILSKIDPVGGGGTSRREVKSSSFPNLFVDDCRNSCSDRLFRSFRLSGEQQFTLSLSSSQIQSINKIIIINVFICHKIKTTNVMLHIFHSKKRN